MTSTATLIDLALYRKRKQAQQRARAMWDLYLRNAAFPASVWLPVPKANESRLG